MHICMLCIYNICFWFMLYLYMSYLYTLFFKWVFSGFIYVPGSMLKFLSVPTAAETFDAATSGIIHSTPGKEYIFFSLHSDITHWLYSYYIIQHCRYITALKSIITLSINFCYCIFKGHPLILRRNFNLQNPILLIPKL